MRPLAIAIPVCAGGLALPHRRSIDRDRQAGTDLYPDHCASCHGAQLESSPTGARLAPMPS